MTVIVNGSTADVGEGSVISDILRSLGLNADRVAVELNQKIIRRAEWGSTRISEGDRVEIVHFVGGGESDT